jgi:hypothetical protein
VWVLFGGRGRFGLRDLGEALWGAGGVILLGLPLSTLVRVIVRSIVGLSRARGSAATALGVALTFALVVPLVYVFPIRIGVGCLPLGLIGGIIGALEAKDRCQQVV